MVGEKAEEVVVAAADLDYAQVDTGRWYLEAGVAAAVLAHEKHAAVDSVAASIHC